MRREQVGAIDQGGTDMDGVGALAKVDGNGNHGRYYDPAGPGQARHARARRRAVDRAYETSDDGGTGTPAISSCMSTVLTSALTDGRPVSIVKCAHSR